MYVVMRGSAPVLFVVLWSLVGSLSAATYYVSPDGSDQKRGSRRKPWATLRHAASRVTPGDIVRVRPGRYRQREVITRCHGTPERPIVFEADGGEVTFDASVPVTGWRHEGGSRYSADIDEIRIFMVWSKGRLLLGPDYRRDFEPVKPTVDTLRRGQSLVQDGRLHVRLFDDSDPNNGEMRISHGHCILLQNTRHTIWRGIGTAWGLDGYKLEAGSSHNLISDAELHHHMQGILEISETAAETASQFNVFQRLHIHDVGLTKYNHGIYTDGIRTRILDCRFDHISGAAIHAYPNPIQGEYSGNRITEPLPTYRPENFDGDPPPEPRRHYTAIIAWGLGGHLIINNVIQGPFSHGVSLRSPANRVWNNTIALTSGGTAIRIAEGHADNRVGNNAILTKGLYLAGEIPSWLDYNGYFGGTGWLFTDTRLFGIERLRETLRLEKHGLVADPRFVNSDDGDLRLASPSPFRDAGTMHGAPATDAAGILRPQGSGVDLGAFEGPDAVAIMPTPWGGQTSCPEQNARHQ